MPTVDDAGDSPHKRFRVVVGFSEQAIDRGLEVDKRFEHAAFKPTPGQLREEALAGLERPGWPEMKDELGVAIHLRNGSAGTGGLPGGRVLSRKTAPRLAVKMDLLDVR